MSHLFARLVLVTSALLVGPPVAIAMPYQNGRPINPVDSLALVRIFTAVPGSPSTDPTQLVTKVTDVECDRPTRSCTYTTIDGAGSILSSAASAALIDIVDVAGLPPNRGSLTTVRLAKVTCRFSLLVQSARCWVIEHP